MSYSLKLKKKKIDTLEKVGLNDIQRISILLFI